MNQEPSDERPSRRYRVLYYVTRGEYYEIAASSEEQACQLAFSDGKRVDYGETTGALPCEIKEIAAVPPDPENMNDARAAWPRRR